MGRELSEAIVDGILGGSVYALMAVGLTLIFGVLDIINIAQGILVVLGAYLSYVLSVHLHIDLFVGLLVTVPAMFIIGVAIQWAFIRPLRGRERTSMSLLATYAVAIIIEGVLYIIFGSNYVNLNASYVTSGPEIFGFYLDYIYIYGFLMALAAGGGDLLHAVPDPLRPERPGHHAGPDGGPAGRHQREPGAGAHVRHRGGRHRCGRNGVRRHRRRLQPEHRI